MKQEYENIIDEYVNNFEKTISKDDAEKEELVNEFKNYLNYLLEIFLENEKIEKDEESIKSWINFKTRHFKDMSTTELKRRLLKDNALEDIKEKSCSFFRLAQKRINGEDIEIKLDKEKETEKIQEELKNVKPYNIEIAKQYILEGILDLNYAINPDSNVTSLRLGHIINYQKVKRKDEER